MGWKRQQFSIIASESNSLPMSSTWPCRWATWVGRAPRPASTP